MSCSSGCPTPGLHATFGECLRSKNLQVQDVEAHKFNGGVRRELDDYRKAREAGLQPASTNRRDIDAAWRITEKTGTAFRADK